MKRLFMAAALVAVWTLWSVGATSVGTTPVGAQEAPTAPGSSPPPSPPPHAAPAPPAPWALQFGLEPRLGLVWNGALAPGFTATGAEVLVQWPSPVRDWRFEAGLQGAFSAWAAQVTLPLGLAWAPGKGPGPDRTSPPLAAGRDGAPDDLDDPEPEAPRPAWALEAAAHALVGLGLFRPEPLPALGAQALVRVLWGPGLAPGGPSAEGASPGGWTGVLSLGLRFETSPEYSRRVAPWAVWELPVQIGLRWSSPGF